MWTSLASRLEALSLSCWRNVIRAWSDVSYSPPLDHAVAKSPKIPNTLNTARQLIRRQAKQASRLSCISSSLRHSKAKRPGERFGNDAIFERKMSIDRVRCKPWRRNERLLRHGGREVEGDFSELRNIRQPTLVVNGSRDIMIPSINSYTLSQHIPYAQLIIYPDSGHGSLFQYPGFFVNHAELFLAS